MDAEPQLSLSEFSFSYQTQQAIDPSLLTPSLWLGIFGHALHQQVCLVPESPECKGCMFIQQCDYPYLFEGIKPLDKKNDNTSPSIPAPHIFKTVTEQMPQVLNQQQQINISVILVGKATQRLTVLINAMTLAGSNGNGIGKARIPLQLKRVTQNSQSLSQLILKMVLYTKPCLHKLF